MKDVGIDVMTTEEGDLAQALNSKTFDKADQNRLEKESNLSMDLHGSDYEYENQDTAVFDHIEKEDDKDKAANEE